MESVKKMQALGVTFLICGASFLAVGLVADMLVFSILGPSILTLGIVFLAVSTARARRDRNEKRRAGIALT